VLQGVEADEHGIRRQKQVVISTDACATALLLDSTGHSFMLRRTRTVAFKTMMVL